MYSLKPMNIPTYYANNAKVINIAVIVKIFQRGRLYIPKFLLNYKNV